MQQTNKTHNDNEKYGRRLERRSRGVTTLHHYKRISSRDLGWHRRETEGEEVKQIASWQTSETTNLERLNERKVRIQGRWTRLKTLRYQRGTRNIARTFVGWRIWNKSLTDQKEYESTPVEKVTRNSMWTLEFAKLWMTRTMDEKYMQALRLKRDVQGMIMINYDNAPVGKWEG